MRCCTARESEVARCPICATAGERRYRKDRFAILVCPSCTFVFSHPVPTAEELLASYAAPDAYAADGHYRPRGGPLRRWRNTMLARTLKSYQREGRLLEIGCGQGDFIAAARLCGFEAMGLEPAPAPARYARSLGLTVHQGTLEQARFPPASFDAVVALHVIEHVTDPVRLFESAARLVAPGGVVLLQMPCVSHWKARRAGISWHYLTPPGHLWFFTPTSVRRLFDRFSIHPVYIHQHLIRAHMTAIGRVTQH